MLVNVVNGHVQKRQQKRITKKKRWVWRASKPLHFINYVMGGQWISNDIVLMQDRYKAKEIILGPDTD